MNRHIRSIFATITVGVATLAIGTISGCGSDETPSSPVAATTDTPPGETAADTTTGAAADTTVPAASSGADGVVPAAEGTFDICATVPALEVINSVLDEPVTGVDDLERGPGAELCEAAGDGIANVQFGRLTDVDRPTVDALAAENGYPVSELDDPTLPGAFTYAGVVAVIIDGTEWSVQAITLDTIGDPGSPAAVERSATLLRAWLPLLGLA